jgi:branched-chain amino acid transport system substrate-binding protein
MKLTFMKLNAKRNAWIVVFALAILALVLVIAFKATLERPLYIAVVSTMSGKYQTKGQAIVNAVRLYIDRVNQAGGINGKQVKLLQFDDEGDPEVAQKRASEIAAQNKALVVLGHSFSSTCVAGGKVYKNAKIPAITPSCTADHVTERNDWYFSVVPNNSAQGTFLANYAKRVLKHDRVTIVYDDQDDYSRSLVNGFETPFRGLRGTIPNKWIVNVKAGKTDEQINAVTKGFLRENPGLIFLALQTNDAKKFIISMRRKGLQSPILGGDALGKTNFATRFTEEPEERVQPGYFTDGMYAAAPLIFDVAGERLQQARSLFMRRYGEEPNWGVATAFDAAMVAVEAMKKLNLQGNPENRVEERQRLRDYIAKRTRMKKAIKGINGHFYFDKHGNAVKPLAIGVFKNQQFISALTQFQPVDDLQQVVHLQEELAAGRIVTIAGQYMHKTHLVYTGIDFNSVTNLDVKNATYQMDFYLWFRSKKGVDASDIEFINSVDSFQKLKSDKAIVEETATLGNPIVDDGQELSYKAYRVKADFKSQFHFKKYPFDKQILAVQFRHTKLTRNNLIYVVDFVGIGETTKQGIMAKLERNNVFSAISDWKIKRANFFQNIMDNESTLGNPNLFRTDSHLKYSRFNAIIKIKRDTLGFITKNLLPLLFLVGISYLIMFLPFDENAVMAISGTLMAVVFFHLSLASGLPDEVSYAVALDHAFYVIYGLIIFQLLLVVIAQRERAKHNEIVLQRLVLTGRAGYPVVFLIAVISFVYLYGELRLFPVQSRSTSSQIASQNLTAPKTTDDKVTLIFGAWRTARVDKINRVFGVFSAEHPNISVKFQPAAVEWYTPMLEFQLEKGIAPDVFYLRSFSRSQPLFEADYLEPLGNLPGLTENFDRAAREPWISENGEPYAVPFQAVSHGIYYNIDLFKELNLAVPTTWEALLTTARALKKAGYIPFANGIKTGWATSELIFMNLAPNFIGGREGRQKYESGERCFDDKHVVAAFQAVADLAPFLPGNPETISFGQSKQLFLQAKAAMFLGHSLNISTFKQGRPGFEWGILAMPAPKGQPEYVTYHPNFGIGLNAASKHKKEAKLLLEWLTKPETGELLSNEFPGFFPMHKTAPALRNKHARAFLALNEGRDTDVRWAFPKLMESSPNGKALMQNNTAAVIMGQKTPQEAATALQDGLAQWFEPAQKCFQFAQRSDK